MTTSTPPGTGTPAASSGSSPVFVAGSVELLAAHASDLDVVNAARASFGSSVTEMTPKEEGLVGYLMRNRHGSPFEHGMFTFRVKAPLFVNREWFRHRIGSFNEESGRYSELAMEFYLPEGRVRRQVGKPGAYTFEPATHAQDVVTCSMLAVAYGTAARTYELLLEQGCAKEIARLCLPLATMSTFVWTVNPRSLMNFLSLRNSEHAQREIREYAEVVEGYFREAMPLTHDAFLLNGRVAP